LKKFPNFKQTKSKDCGPTCIKITAKFYGKIINIQELRKYSETTRDGSNLLMLSDAAEKIGFRTLGIKASLKKLEEAPPPCILHWNKNHYVVLHKIKKAVYYISDPAIGLLDYNETDFLKFWIGNNVNESIKEVIDLLLEPISKF